MLTNPFFRKAELWFEIIADSATVRALDSALALEADEKRHRGKRCEIKVRSYPLRVALDNESDATLRITFKSNDLVSLRAGFNSNLRLVASALKTLEKVKL